MLFRMFNLDLNYDEILEDIFTENIVQNEEKVKKFCADILNDQY
jgi:hypothetical protein